MDNPGYGVFIKNSNDEMKSQGEILDEVVIKGRSRNKIKKIISYVEFSVKVWFFYLFKKYDLVYVHYVAHSLIPLVPIYSLKNTPLVCNAHGEDLLPRNKIERIIFRFVSRLIRKSKMLVVPSIFFKEIAEFKFPSLKVEVSPSGGVNREQFFPIIKEDGFFYGNKKLKIGFVSRIDEGKGWDILITAVSLLRTNYPTLELEVFIAGEGGSVEDLKLRINEYSLTDVVSYVGGLPQEKLPDFYRFLDVFIFPTEKNESLGLVGLEAMACGVPAICSAIGGIKTYVENGVNGYLFTPGNYQELADTIFNFSQLSLPEFLRVRDGALKTAQRYDRKVVISELKEKLAGL